MKLSVCLAGIVCGLFVAPVTAADEVTECDRLAAHGSDPERIAPGVSQGAMSKAAAQAACEAAVAVDPNNRRLRYQLGRAYFYDGKFGPAMPHLEFAAEAGGAQAQFVLGYIFDNGFGGIAKDPCRVEDLWVKSARQGRFAAQVSYPHHVMRGRFEGCAIQASTEEMGAFIAAAKNSAEDYYQTMLVSVLDEEFRAFQAKGK